MTVTRHTVKWCAYGAARYAQAGPLTVFVGARTVVGGLWPPALSVKLDAAVQTS